MGYRCILIYFLIIHISGKNDPIPILRGELFDFSLIRGKRPFPGIGAAHNHQLDMCILQADHRLHQLQHTLDLHDPSHIEDHEILFGQPQPAADTLLLFFGYALVEACHVDSIFQQMSFDRNLTGSLIFPDHKFAHTDHVAIALCNVLRRHIVNMNVIHKLISTISFCNLNNCLRVSAFRNDQIKLFSPK